MKRMKSKKHTDLGEREVLPNGMVVYRHHRDPNATLESLHAALGIVSLTGPVPSWKFLEEDEPETSDDHAGE